MLVRESLAANKYIELVSCDNCGVVLDKDKLQFPEDPWVNGEVDPTKAIWYDREYYLCTPCPVCKELIKGERV